VLLIDSVEMGAGLALHFCKAISRLDRQESESPRSICCMSTIDRAGIMPNIGGWPSDSSNLVSSQFAAKNYYMGELSGARHVLEQGGSSSPDD
jgi:phosphatidylinositol 4-kinase